MLAGLVTMTDTSVILVCLCSHRNAASACVFVFQFMPSLLKAKDSVTLTTLVKGNRNGIHQRVLERESLFR